MLDNDEFTIDCKTCIGSGTTACNDCVVMHLLANEDGPIDYVPVQLTPVQLTPAQLTPVPRLAEPYEVAIEMLQRAGLVDDPPHFVTVAEFEAHPLLVR